MNLSRSLFVILFSLGLFLGVSHGQAATIDLISGGQSSCLSCHPVTLDDNHSLSCTICHQGDATVNDLTHAHIGLIIHPAAPDRMVQSCSPCHSQVNDIGHSLHYTVATEINTVRRHFGADQELTSAADIPDNNTPSTLLELVDDLLRRSCLHCHISSPGDDYDGVQRGTGCAACHLSYENGRLKSHVFQRRPADTNCLHCHYANRVGSDYYGLFEHDFKDEYRTPYRPDGEYPERPFGVERHHLTPDVHQQAGLSCVDCHSGAELMQGATPLSCAGCHLWRPGSPVPAANLSEQDSRLFITTRNAGQQLPIPPANSPVHQMFTGQADCTVCHAQWSFFDRGHALLRMDLNEFEEWSYLIVQSSFEVENTLLTNLYGDELLPPVMTDKLTGLEKPGIWLQGYSLRRWERVVIGRGKDGRLAVMRPILDLQLSWVNDQGETVFDSIQGKGPTLLPYTPHTIGPAGAFYRLRLRETPPEPAPSGGKTSAESPSPSNE
ncbi:MAG: hypothetical protein KJ950_13640 [Proteobacteria bacterium]|nr:hypothetical protein [Pseudomonadota bacterium]MBU1686052.1 hypothetical protein [Pseudomonadota bacterium]